MHGAARSQQAAGGHTFCVAGAGLFLNPLALTLDSPNPTGPLFIRARAQSGGWTTGVRAPPGGLGDGARVLLKEKGVLDGHGRPIDLPEEQSS